MDWIQLDKGLKYLLPFVFCLLILYFYVSFLSDRGTDGLITILEAIIIVYFVIELVVKYKLSDNLHSFFVKHWVKIILILPFLRIFRVFGFIGNGLRYMRLIPYVQKLAKLPKMAKATKFIFLFILFKISLIKNQDKIEKEKEKVFGK